MSSSHLKRLPAPKTWRIAKKKEKYVTRPKPGAHELELAMPLGTVMIYLGLADTKKEVKHILQHQEVLVDGKQRHSERHPVGFMDVLTVPEAGVSYRITITSKGLEAIEVPEDEEEIKPVKVTGKKDIKGGKTQITTMDGRTIRTDDDYNVGDTLIIELPSQDVKERLELEEGATILLYKGRHAGEIGSVEGAEGKKLTFKSGDEVFETRREYAFVIGKDGPAVKVQPE